MSSSVLKGEAARRLPPVAWREYGAAPSGPVRPAPPAGQPPDSQAEKAAYERGLRAGEAAAARQAQEQLQAALHGLARTAAELAGYKTALRAEAERELLALAMAVARRVLRRELSLDPGIIQAVMRSCLEELRHAEVYRLRLHPQDAPAVAGFFQQQQSKVEVLPDSRITRGGAVFETSRGQLDARLETQLEEIERGLADG
jgi:flagellar assembly protein FliH